MLFLSSLLRLLCLSIPSLPSALLWSSSLWLLWLAVLHPSPVVAIDTLENGVIGVTTFAGLDPTPGSTNGIGTISRFHFPRGVSISSDGSFALVSDTSNHNIRHIVLSTATVTTLAGDALTIGSTNGIGTNSRFNYPGGITISSDGSFALVADTENHIIRYIVISAAIVTNLAGDALTSGSTNGIGTNSRFNYPQGVSISSDGSFALISDSSNHIIRHIVLSTATVTNLAGNALTSGFTNGIGTNSRFNYPGGITISSDGSFALIADLLNHLIRYIVISTATVTTLAGVAETSGSTNGIGTNSNFNVPSGVAISPDGSFALVSDYENNLMRHIVISTASVTNLAGEAESPGSTNGIGTNSRFYNPHGVSISSDGPIALVADVNNKMIRHIVISTASMTAFAGVASTTGSTNGVGTNSRFYNPHGVSISSNDVFALVADTSNHIIRHILISTYFVSTFAGEAGSSNSTNGIGTNSRFDSPHGVSISSDGSFALVADTWNNLVRHIVISTAIVTTLAGEAESWGSEDGIGTNSRFSATYAAVISPDGSYALIADHHNHNLRHIVISSAMVTTFAGVAESSGSTNGIGTNSRFYYPNAIEISPDGSFALVLDDNHNIRHIVISTASVTNLAGLAGSPGYTNGIGTNSRFNLPYGITISSDGSFALVADTDNNLIRHIVLSTATVTTLAGVAESSGSTDDIGTNSRFNYPRGITISSDGSFALVADTSNSLIRWISAVSTSTDTPTFSPTVSPSVSPSFAPTASPTFPPTFSPTVSPSVSPSFAPTASPTFSPTFSPSVAPTYFPSTSPTSFPSAFPSFQPTSQHYTLTCPPYSAQFTSNATQNTALCSFWVCPYESVSVSLCDTCNSTNTFIRLLDSSDAEIAFNDKGGSFDCGSCSSLSFIYNQSTVRCDKLSLHQGCRNSESCVGESRITIEATTDEVVKYSFGVIFGDTTILESNRGLLLDYHLNAARGKVRPVSYLVDPSVIMNETNTSPSTDWMLIKWRAVHVDRNSNTINTRGSWEDSTLIPSGILSTWIVSSTTSNILGFVVQDLNTTNHHIYFVDNTINLSSRRLLTDTDIASDPPPPFSRQLSINNPGIAISNETITVQSLRKYIKEVSNQRIYLLNSQLEIGVVTFS